MRLGVVGGRRRALAAEEKKSPVVGGSRLGDLLGVLKLCTRLELVGVGVVARVTWWSSVKRSSRPSSSTGGRFSLSAWSLSETSNVLPEIWLLSLAPSIELRFGFASSDRVGEGKSTRLVGCGVRSSTSMGTCSVPPNLCGEDLIALSSAATAEASSAILCWACGEIVCWLDALRCLKDGS